MATLNGVADVQSLASTDDYSVADSGHGQSEDSDHSRLALSTFRSKWKQPRPPRQPRAPRSSAASDDTGLYIVETAERLASGAGPWTAQLPYGNNLASGCSSSDKLSRYKSRQPQISEFPSTRAAPSTIVPLGRTSGRGAERSLKKNNEDYAAVRAPATTSTLPPVSPSSRSDGRPLPAPAPPALQSHPQRRAAAAQNLSPVASSTDANMSDLESSTSGSFLMLGPHGASRLAPCVSEL